MRSRKTKDGIQVLAFALALTSGTASAQSQMTADEALGKAHLTMAAFKCSYLAKEPKDQTRFMRLGYAAGIDFFKQVQANSQVDKDLQGRMPIGWLGASGTSVDFVLGRIYERMVRSVDSELDREELRTPAHLTIVRSNMYGISNCRALR
jgi:hypothetical protein